MATLCIRQCRARNVCTKLITFKNMTQDVQPDGVSLARAGVAAACVAAACAHVKQGDTQVCDGSGPGRIRHTYVSLSAHVSGGCQCVMLSTCKRN